MSDLDKIPLHIITGPPGKQSGADKMARKTARFETDAPRLRKPAWIRVRLPAGNAVEALKSNLRNRELVTVCEEASCPNIHECFSKGTATFMVLGEICTRRCSFCDVAHGRPRPPDRQEPERLASTVRDMGLRYVVITSVDRDDLRDGGAGHFAECISQVRAASPGIRVEILVPDFRGKGRVERALELFAATPPDVFNHNIETVEALYRNVRPGADYRWSLDLLSRFKQSHPDIPT
ncbi:MAG: lipoyl synthase, partial [Lysobacterales bacterium]